MVGQPQCDTHTNVLVVFDFDWSLINENSDTWVVKELAPSLYPEFCAKAKSVPWTTLMDQTIVEMMKPPHLIPELALRQALERIPADETMFAAVRYAHQQGSDLQILSDANDHFIATVLEKHNLSDLFSAVHTNPTAWQDGVLRISPYDLSQGGHGCPRCPPNLCKGQVLERIMQEGHFSKVIYIGDGGGDFCPATKLRSGDVMCCRRGYPCHRMVEKQMPHGSLSAQVVLWDSGQEILQCFMDAIPK
eukprot:GGOE01018840.1.p1 GENE.GGOE01018840.1~~GGOE01018840.1.p1  ORF type:complete len:248 (-),score=35.23 GGOE01018840.1:50-793(-)